MSKDRPAFIFENMDLKPINSWKVGGCADFFCEPKTVDELREAWTWAHSRKLPVTVYSSGTNVLISDRGIRGLTVNMRSYRGVIDQSDSKKINLLCRAGTPKSEILKVFLKQKLSPALFLTGLPGDVGGGVAMNAGVSTDVSPKEFGEIVQSFTVLTPPPELKIKTFAHDEINWSYRHTQGWQPGIILDVMISWPNTPDEKVMERARELTRRRVQTQPLDKPSGGSTFRNPSGHKAGQLIEQAGLKGFRLGGAEVSTKHANFIITDEKALASDVDGLIQLVQKTVHEKSGIRLQPEVVYLGEW